MVKIANKGDAVIEIEHMNEMSIGTRRWEMSIKCFRFEKIAVRFWNVAHGKSFYFLKRVWYHIVYFLRNAKNRSFSGFVCQSVPINF